MLTTIAIGSGLAATSGYIYYGRAGGHAAKLVRGSSKLYDDNLKDLMNRWIFGTRPKPMVLQRDGTDKDGSLNFIVKEFSYFDAENVKEKLEKIGAEKVDLEKLDKAREEKKEGKKLEVEKETEEKKDIEYFTIKLKVKNPNVRVGEIDFADWGNRNDFEIKVYKKGQDRALDTLSEDYIKVVTSLKKYAKTTSAKLTPEKLAKNEISERHGDGITGLFGGLDRIRSALGKYEFFSYLGIGDSTLYMSTDLDAKENEFLNTTACVSGLLQLVTDKAKDEDYSILENYFGVREQDLKNELYAAEVMADELEKEVEEREKKKREARVSIVKSMTDAVKSKAKKILFWSAVIIGGIIVTATITTLALIGISILFPPTAPFLTPIIAAVITSAGGAATFVATTSLSAVKTLFSTISTGLVSGLSSLAGLAAPLGSFLISPVGITFAGFLVLGYVIKNKGISDYNDQHLELAKKELDDAKELKDRVKKDSEEIEKVKLGSLYTIKEIRAAINDGRKVLDFTDKNIGDFGLGLICEHLHRKDIGPLTAQELVLSNCSITDKGVIALAHIIGTAQTDPKQPNMFINTIDLTGNKIVGISGLNVVSDALSRNFTLTVLNYDSIDRSKASRKTLNIVNNIDRQLIINRYLQGVDIWQEKKRINQTRFNELFNNGMEELKKEAEEKLRSNYTIKAFPSLSCEANKVKTLPNEVARQNNLLANLETSKDITATDYIEVFKIDPERSLKFMLRFKEPADPVKIKIQEAILRDPLKLCDLKQEECIKALESILLPANPDDYTINHPHTKEKIKIFAAILPNLPKEPKEIRLYMKDTVLKAYVQLASDQTPKTFKEKLEGKLEGKRNTIATSELKTEIKRSMLTALDLALHPEAHEDQETLNRIQLEKLIQNRPLDSLQTLEEFMAIYKKMEPTSLETTKIDQNKLVTLIQTDIRKHQDPNKMCSLLKTADEKHRFSLLKKCFGYEKKTSLVSKLISMTKGLSSAPEALKNTCRHEFLILKAFTEPKVFGYEKLKSELERIRTTWKAEESMYITEEDEKELTREEIKEETLEEDETEKILQTQLQEEFTKTYKCLQSPYTDQSDFGQLQENLKKYYLLRKFDLPEGLNPDVKEFLATTIYRNQLREQLHDNPKSCNKSEILHEFLVVLTNIEDKNQRINALSQVLKTDGEIILELVKDDIKNSSKVMLEDKEDQDKIIELLTACHNHESSQKEMIYSHAVALIISKLLAVEPKLDNEHIYNIFTTWSFNRSIKELKELEREDINQIIQTVLRENILRKLSKIDLKSEKLPTFLTKELEENYELTDIKRFKLDEQNINYASKKYIEYICNRNLLKNLAETSSNNLELFFATYSEMPSDYRIKALKHIDGPKLLAMIAKDLGSESNLTCKNLKTLDKEYRIKLLDHCFSLDSSEKLDAVKRKSQLIANLLDIPELFKETEDSTIKNIQYMIYWAIAGKEAPYYKLADLITSPPVYSFLPTARKYHLPGLIKALPKGEFKNKLNDAVVKAKEKPLRIEKGVIPSVVTEKKVVEEPKPGLQKKT